MVSKEIAKRYSQAVFEASKDLDQTDLVYNELKEIKKIFEEPGLKQFFSNPTNDQKFKQQCVQTITEKYKVSNCTKSLLLLLAEKNRTQIIPDICDEFQNYIDKENGVIRGKVVSSTTLSPEEREKIEAIVSEKTKKRVILNYIEDSKLIGGMCAYVDGYTFDDTLSMHLNKLNEDLKRRVH